MKKTIVLMGRFDSKGKEYAYVKEKILSGGFDVVTVDTGSRGSPVFKPDISREEVAKAAGVEMKNVIDRTDESKEIQVMGEGAAKIARRLLDSGKLDGIMCLGGSRGTNIGTSAMRALPFGIHKVMVSTVASGDVRSYVGTRDIMILHSVTDIIGLNRMTKRLLAYAAGAAMGAVTADPGFEVSNKPLIAMSSMGGINRTAFLAQQILEETGFELAAFHATGTGGQAMEETIEQGLIGGVLDLVTHELIDSLYGGTYNAGPMRLETAGKKGIPQVIVPGCLDFIAFSPPENIPQKFKDRKVFKHTPEVAIVRATKDEMAGVGKAMADKLNKSTGPTVVVIPKKGFSPANREGRPLYDPEADAAFVQALKENIKQSIQVIEIDAHINDEVFARQATELLVEMMKGRV